MNLETIRIYWPLIVALAGVAGSIGYARAVISEFRREVSLLRDAAKPIVEIKERLAATEATVRGVVDRDLPDIKREIVRVHDASKASIAAVRGEITQAKTELRAEIHAHRSEE